MSAARHSSTDFDTASLGYDTQDPPEFEIDDEVISHAASSRTVLPSPFAAFISLATATSSIGLKVGSFFGLAALDFARAGTLAGFDLLDSLVSREGQALGLRYIVSAGFDLGSTGLSTGIATAQFFLTTLHAILGDSQTSRAVAAIYVLFQREITDPERNINGDSASLADFLTGSVAFILLQRWGEGQTRRTWREEGVEERICEVVANAKEVGQMKADASDTDTSSTIGEGDEQSETLWSTDNRETLAGEETPASSPRSISETFEGVVVDRQPPMAMDDSPLASSTSAEDETMTTPTALRHEEQLFVNGGSWQTPVRRALRQNKPVEKLVNFWDPDRSRLTTSEELQILPALPEPDEEPEFVSQQRREYSSAKTEAALPLIHCLTRFSKFAVASYGSAFLKFTNVWQDDLASFPTHDDLPEHQFFSTFINLPNSTVLLSSYVDSQGSRPAADVDNGLPLVHYISIDHETKAVVLTIRGTLGFEDLLTDSVCDYDKICWQGEMHRVHKGILASARRLITLHDGRVLTAIKEALDEHEGYGVVLCGHSLGGGVAALLSLLLAEPSLDSSTGSEYITAARPFCNNTVMLPARRPIHAYTYGCAACFAPSLARNTMGLITTVIQGQDFIPYLSLGTLRDFQAIGLSFKHDSHDAKSEVLRRVREQILQAFTQHTGLGALQGMVAGLLRGRQQEPESRMEESAEESEEDHWPWVALKTLRAHLLSDKLVPPGELFLLESTTLTAEEIAYRSEAATEAADVMASDPSTPRSPSPSVGAPRTFESAASTQTAELPIRITLTHVHDVERRFAELRFGPSMFADHLPGRYERVLKLFERNAYAGKVS